VGREADHSRPSSIEVKNEWSYISTWHLRDAQYIVVTCYAEFGLKLYLSDVKVTVKLPLCFN
jgi:hypothetical protein